MKYKTPELKDLRPGLEYEEFIPKGTHSIIVIDFEKNTTEKISENDDMWVKRKFPKINYPEVYKYGDIEVTDYVSPMITETSLLSQLTSLIQKGWIRING